MYLRGQNPGISMRHKHYVFMDNIYSCNGSKTVYPTSGISFTDKGKNISWSGVFVWGIQVYISGGYNAGNTFKIRQVKKAVSPMQGLGPNKILVPPLLHSDYVTPNPFSVRHPTLIPSQGT